MPVVKGRQYLRADTPQEIAILFQEAKKMGLDKDETLINKRESYFIKLVVGAY